jgi:galactitol-specific phosphotransferase system IIB component
MSKLPPTPKQMAPEQKSYSHTLPTARQADSDKTISSLAPSNHTLTYFQKKQISIDKQLEKLDKFMSDDPWAAIFVITRCIKYNVESCPKAVFVLAKSILDCIDEYHKEYEEMYSSLRRP